MSHPVTYSNFGSEVCEILGIKHCTSIAIIHRVGEVPRAVATIRLFRGEELEKITAVVRRYELKKKKPSPPSRDKARAGSAP